MYKSKDFIPGTVVFFDLETSGLSYIKHEIIQIAAVAINRDYEILDEFEAKLKFDLEKADPRSLKINSYDKEIWDMEAISASRAIIRFDSFLENHKGIELISDRTGEPYTVALLAGHNVVSFDIKFLSQAFRSMDNRFMPASFQGLDTLVLASWWRKKLVRDGNTVPKNIKLETLCEWFEIELVDAHDALADVRANVSLSKALCIELGIQ